MITLISHLVLSCNLTRHHNISFHLPSPDLTSPHLTSSCLTSLYFTLHHSPHPTHPTLLPSPDIISPHFLLSSHYLTLHDIVSLHLHLTSPHVASPLLTSPHLSLLYISSPCFTLPDLTSPLLPHSPHHHTVLVCFT